MPVSPQSVPAPSPTPEPRWTRRRPALGYADWHALITGTCHEDTGPLARLTGWKRQTITYWRRKIIGLDWKTISGYVHPNRAAAYARIDEEFTAR
ncbi:hypothetical protein GCM10023196_003900 [Actinoallomurus vinaceus]|uniref:Uncharacterized protein n=1 Tax=Actinoallomurus vinaceus TaxID=1080074 RepID=A0ABP8U1W3_9ACTN